MGLHKREIHDLLVLQQIPLSRSDIAFYSSSIWSCHQASSLSECFMQHLTSSQPHCCNQPLRAFLSSFELCQWPGREAGKRACNHHKAGRKQQWVWNPPIQLSYKTILLTILAPWPHLSSLTRKEQTNCFHPWWGRKRERYHCCSDTWEVLRYNGNEC